MGRTRRTRRTGRTGRTGRTRRTRGRIGIGEAGIEQAPGEHTLRLLFADWLASQPARNEESAARGERQDPQRRTADQDLSASNQPDAGG
jgi:uncharacterized protein (TIGR02996 family)